MRKPITSWEDNSNRHFRLKRFELFNLNVLNNFFKSSIAFPFYTNEISVVDLI